MLTMWYMFNFDEIWYQFENQYYIYFFLLLSRSLVFKKGQLLEVSHNFLKDASTIDASEYTSMNIFCNYADKEQTKECIAASNVPHPDANNINDSANKNSMAIAAAAILACLNTLFWHFWWIIPIIIISLVRNYDFFFLNNINYLYYFVFFFSWLFINIWWEWTSPTIHHFTKIHYIKRK